MARPIKTGLDYFPMDVDTDEKFELIEAKHDLVGFGIVVKLYQKIYKSGYFIYWDEEKLLIFKKSINVDKNKVIDVINDCLEYGVFDLTLYDKYKILTSKGIQKRFLSACERRKYIELIKNYIIVDINCINVAITWVNDYNSTQSKVKESKVKESRVKKNIKHEDFSSNQSDFSNSSDSSDSSDLNEFDKFRKAYKGNKRGLETEFINFKRHKDWKLCLAKLLPSFQKEIEYHENAKQSNAFVPDYANLSTWINQRRWETEFKKIEINKEGVQNGRSQQVSDSITRKQHFIAKIEQLASEQNK